MSECELLSEKEKMKKEIREEISFCSVSHQEFLLAHTAAITLMVTLRPLML